MKTAGVILCGGYSRRMGSDKARIELQGETVLSRVFRSMSSVVTPVLVSCRPDQHFDVATLSGHGDDSVAIEVFDAVEDAGPLGGILSCFRRLSADGFDAALITACDHPLVPHAVFQYLYDQAEVLATENARAMALQYGGRTYPMPGLYRVDGLDTLEERIRSGALRLLEWVEGCQPSYLPLDVLMELDPDLRSLINMNSPAEVAAIQCLLRENG